MTLNLSKTGQYLFEAQINTLMYDWSKENPNATEEEHKIQEMKFRNAVTYGLLEVQNLCSNKQCNIFKIN